MISPQTTYDRVKVLLLYWEKSDLKGLKREIDRLERVFQDIFKFQTNSWAIPSKNSASDLLRLELGHFVQGARKKELLILYYGGHAESKDGVCAWYALKEGGPSLDWSSHSTTVTDTPSDVLFILDCCNASSAAAAFSGGQARLGNNWLLASSGMDKFAEGVSRMDFTQLMTRELKDLAYRFQFQLGAKFSSEDLHTAMHLDHWRRLRTSAVHIRLNRKPCGPIDLTPLDIGKVIENEDEYDSYDETEQIPVIEGLGKQETPLPPKMSQRWASVDIVLVPGGSGNLSSSFSGQRGSEICLWPRDVLCFELERQGIRCLLLPFQFRWNDHSYSKTEFERCSHKLAKDLISFREGCEQIPLVFLAYGRGCTVVRRVIHFLSGTWGQ